MKDLFRGFTLLCFETSDHLQVGDCYTDSFCANIKILRLCHDRFLTYFYDLSVSRLFDVTQSLIVTALLITSPPTHTQRRHTRPGSTRAFSVFRPRSKRCFIILSRYRCVYKRGYVWRFYLVTAEDIHFKQLQFILFYAPR